MPGKEYKCKVVYKKWLTPTVFDIRFEPHKGFKFEAGQFVSVVVPNQDPKGKPLRRAYSLAVAPGDGFGLCVKRVLNGPGSGYLANLEVGDTFKIFAPYGEFVFDTKSPRGVCFVSTGTGLAPFLSIIRSKEYRLHSPPSAINIFGARTEDEIIMPGFFEPLGVQELNAISQPSNQFSGFVGRVTDLLKSLGNEFAWMDTDFYLCGNGDMVKEVLNILKTKGVPHPHIHKEIYFVAPDRLKSAPLRLVHRTASPPPFKKTG